MLFLHSRSCRLLALRGLHTTARTQVRPPSLTRVGPPSLPRAEQEEFDALVRAASAGQSGMPDAESIKAALKTSSTVKQEAQSTATAATQQEHPDLRKHAPVQFEGDVNPHTGEVGGPKRDPFHAGDGDWQYSGRVTDF
ncbi:hypothetical protein NliqN6_0085 [Naganishia liquefaciens]|uniref:Succinate dehydrogenase assembly factor 4, mitochondrial n=1 Tax=Naganishia liquefaciens TaxID=104408 RepID=A0A8H3TME4_9TREE|nr:hypothetical protein NliqN6_0085 [Naganishia liquefaciens]